MRGSRLGPRKVRASDFIIGGEIVPLTGACNAGGYTGVPSTTQIDRRRARPSTRRCCAASSDPLQENRKINVRVRKAVLPAAGFGTRFLPATKSIPKEIMPLVDRPIIQYAVEEAVASGIEQIIIVIATGRSAIEDHFDSSPSLERWLEERGDIEMLRTIRRISEFGTVAFVHQREQLGLGHAVLMAKDLVGEESFAVLLSDDVMLNPSGAPVTKQLIDAHVAHRGSVVAVQRVEPNEVSRYGILAPLHEEGRLVEIRDLVEKPAVGDAPSNLAVLGRYVLTPRIFDVLEQTSRGAGDEIQLTDAIRSLIQEQPVFGYQFEGTRHDAGTRLGWLKANVAVGLESDDADEFRSYIRGLDLRD
jgi:UTP--glucose-1-phosphate uridylyltransferase